MNLGVGCILPLVDQILANNIANPNVRAIKKSISKFVESIYIDLSSIHPSI
jgi:hypothetical protein